MQLASIGSPLSFNYDAYDQNSGLYVAFQIYDVTTGTPVFVTQVIASYAEFGAYVGSYTESSAKTLLVIGAVYTSNTYSTPDLTRAPIADIWQVGGSSVTLLAFAYPAYDQNASLPMQATVYNLTTGSAVFVENVSMSYVTLGVYFGSCTGTVGQTYQIASVVYTDNTFETVNTARATGCDSFVSLSIQGETIVLFEGAQLTGQSLQAVLVGDV